MSSSPKPFMTPADVQTSQSCTLIQSPKPTRIPWKSVKEMWHTHSYNTESKEKDIQKTCYCTNSSHPKSYYCSCKWLGNGDIVHSCMSCLLEEWREIDLDWDQNLPAHMKEKFHYSKQIIVILKELTRQFQRPEFLLYLKEKHYLGSKLSKQLLKLHWNNSFQLLQR